SENQSPTRRPGRQPHLGRRVEQRRPWPLEQPATPGKPLARMQEAAGSVDRRESGVARERAGEEEHRGNQPKGRRTGYREADSDECSSQQHIERLGAAKQQASNESGKPYVVRVPPGSHPLNLLRRSATIEDPPANLQQTGCDKGVTHDRLAPRSWMAR